MANPYRDTSKRFRSQSLPIELCVKLEQAVGVAPGEKPNFAQNVLISELIINAIKQIVNDVELVPENKRLVTEEIQANEAARAKARGNAKSRPKKKQGSKSGIEN